MDRKGGKVKMLKSLKEILKIDFNKIKGEKEFKKALQMTDEEFDKLIQNGQDATEKNTPAGVRDSRICLDVIDEEGGDQVLPLNLVYEVKTTEYFDMKEHEYKDITNITVYDLI